MRDRTKLENRRGLQIKKIHHLLEGHPESEDPVELHPYGDFFPPGVESMLIGSFPIGKFSHPDRRGEIKKNEFDFYFGGEKNLLWKLLGQCFGLSFESKEDIARMLKDKRMGVADVICSCRRVGGGASDSELYDIEWNLGLQIELKKKGVRKLFFTSKKVQLWFHKLFPDAEFEEVLLLSPSAQSARYVSKLPEFKEWKKAHPEENTFGFILEDYRKKFSGL